MALVAFYLCFVNPRQDKNAVASEKPTSNGDAPKKQAGEEKCVKDKQFCSCARCKASKKSYFLGFGADESVQDMHWVDGKLEAYFHK